MDTTDDIAEETCFQAVEDDCRLLDNLLHREVGPRFMEDIERKRVLAQVCLQEALVRFAFPPLFRSECVVDGCREKHY
ncbi:hypothetical protein BHE74_00054520 [Ensete ventricosum]|nr:hypothetical protein BHE74_00054520 [Ensete ventricosum]